jgi:hypothetical protein
VILDAHLAELYAVATRVLIQAVTRNRSRFPRDFMFQLSKREFANLRSQIVISSLWGGRRSAPYAFTEQGVAMLSSVLKSKRAIAVNIEIMRAFVALRRVLSEHEDLATRIAELEEDTTVNSRLSSTPFAVSSLRRKSHESESDTWPRQRAFNDLATRPTPPANSTSIITVLNSVVGRK